MLNTTFKINKRIYSTYVISFDFSLLYKFPKCVECKYHDKKIFMYVL